MKQTKLLTYQEYYPELDKDWKIKEEFQTCGRFDNSSNDVMYNAIAEALASYKFSRVEAEYLTYSDDEREEAEKRRSNALKTAVKKYRTDLWKFLVEKVYRASVENGIHAFPKENIYIGKLSESGDVYADLRDQSCDHMTESYENVINADEAFEKEKAGLNSGKKLFLLHLLLFVTLIAPLIGFVPGFEQLRLVIPEDTATVVGIVYGALVAILMFCTSIPGYLIIGLASAVHLGLYTNPETVMSMDYIIMAPIVPIIAFIIMMVVSRNAFGKKKLKSNAIRLVRAVEADALDAHRYLTFMLAWYFNSYGYFNAELKERAENIGRIVDKANMLRKKYRIK